MSRPPGREEGDPLRQRRPEPGATRQPAPQGTPRRFREAAVRELLASQAWSEADGKGLKGKGLRGSQKSQS